MNDTPEQEAPEERTFEPKIRRPEDHDCGGGMEATTRAMPEPKPGKSVKPPEGEVKPNKPQVDG